jgi:hypothetical protein
MLMATKEVTMLEGDVLTAAQRLCGEREAESYDEPSAPDVPAYMEGFLAKKVGLGGTIEIKTINAFVSSKGVGIAATNRILRRAAQHSPDAMSIPVDCLSEVLGEDCILTL